MVVTQPRLLSVARQARALAEQFGQAHEQRELLDQVGALVSMFSDGAGQVESSLRDMVEDAKDLARLKNETLYLLMKSRNTVSGPELARVQTGLRNVALVFEHVAAGIPASLAVPGDEKRTHLEQLASTAQRLAESLPTRESAPQIIAPWVSEALGLADLIDDRATGDLSTILSAKQKGDVNRFLQTVRAQAHHVPSQPHSIGPALREIAGVLRAVDRAPAGVQDSAFARWRRLRSLRVGAQGTKWVVERGATTGVMKFLMRADQDEQDVARLEREADILKGLNHPCIVRLVERGHDAERVWLVTEFAAYGSLQTHLAMFARDTWRTLRIARDIATALAYAHPKGVIHRDLKPGNLVLRAPDHVQLVDFGIAHDDDQPTLTMTADKVAPQWYGPPEARQGRFEPTPAFDVYSLGKVIYVMMTGGSRFEGDEMRDAERLSTVLGRTQFAAVDDLVQKMVRVRPADRLQEMGAVVAECDRILWGLFGEPKAAPDACGRCAAGRYVKTGYLHGGAPTQLMSRNDRDVIFSMFAGNVDVLVCNECGDMRLSVNDTKTGALGSLLRPKPR